MYPPSPVQNRAARRSALAALAVAGLLAAGACSSDDGADVRSDGTGDVASASGSGASGSGASGSGTEPVCQPVGDASTADSSQKVTLDEWSVTPEDDTFAGGLVNIVAANVGEEPHEVVVVEGDDIKALPTSDDGAFDEEAYGSDNVLGEIEAFPAGEDCNGVFDLAPGSYILLCNLVEEEDGTIESHFAEGMATVVTVTS